MNKAELLSLKRCLLYFKRESLGKKKVVGQDEGNEVVKIERQCDPGETMEKDP